MKELYSELKDYKLDIDEELFLQIIKKHEEALLIHVGGRPGERAKRKK